MVSNTVSATMYCMPPLRCVSMILLLPSRRIGTEHEKLGFNLLDNTRMDYDKIKGVFERLESRFGWQPITEAGLTIGVLLDGTLRDAPATVHNTLLWP